MALLKYPQTLQFPYEEINRESSCLLRLENLTKKLVLVQIKTTDAAKYWAEGDVGLVDPLKTLVIKVSTRVQEAPAHCRDTFCIESTYVPEDIDDLAPYLNQVDETVTLGVEYIKGKFDFDERGTSMLVVQPTEIKFYIGAKNPESQVALFNQSAYMINFRILDPKIDSGFSYKCHFGTDSGVIPHTTRCFTEATLHARDLPDCNKPWVDIFHIESVRLPIGITGEDMSPQLFKSGKRKAVDLMELRVTYFPVTAIPLTHVPVKRKALEADVLVKDKRADVPPNSNTLYMGNICKEWSKEKVLETLKGFGVEQIDELYLYERPKHEGKSRAFGFIGFCSHSDAMAAFQRLNKPDAVFGCDGSAKVAFAPSLHPNKEAPPQELERVLKKSRWIAYYSKKLSEETQKLTEDLEGRWQHPVVTRK